MKFDLGRRLPSLRPGRLHRAGFCLLVAMLAGCGAGEENDSRERSSPRPMAEAGAPNLLVVMTDDQDLDSFAAMKRVRRLIAERGTTFENSLVSYPLCCPSRATFFTGQLAHNNGVLGNDSTQDGGGYPNLEDPERVLPVWLRAAGYRTAHVGKFIHTYEGSGPPPGWDRFWGFQDEQGFYYDYALQGPDEQITKYGTDDRDYVTSVITRLARREIEEAARQDRPFFTSVGYTAPHTGSGRAADADTSCSEVTVGKSAAQPAPPDAEVEVTTSGRAESFNEKDVSDKPALIRKRPRFDEAFAAVIDRRRACRLASLRAVDRGVAKLVATLREEDALSNTVLVFTSDNGYFQGEHRIPGDKNRPYSEAVEVPLAMSGPGIPVHETIADPVVNTDLAPTLLDLARAKPKSSTSRPQDGVSLVSIIRGKARWPDRAVLIEGRSPGTKTREGGYRVASYQGVRTSRYLLVDYFSEEVESVEDGLDVVPGTGTVSDSELYDLRRDPNELLNRIGEPGLERVESRLRSALDRLSDCEGRACFVRLGSS